MAIHHALGDSVDHVVIIVKENHTFDNYFGTFPKAEGDAHLKHAENPPPDDPDHKHQTWDARAYGRDRCGFAPEKRPCTPKDTILTPGFGYSITPVPKFPDRPGRENRVHFPMLQLQIHLHH